MRLIKAPEAGKKNPKKKFPSWENTVLIKAKDFDHAYVKASKIGRQGAENFRGGPMRVPMRWVFEGITELLPVYEDIEDGAEIMWAEHPPRTLKALRRLVKSKRAFRQ